MSYLNPIRLHFSGQFQADPSTVNNDVRHFNNATFQPQFQKPQTADFMNGWWEPEGGCAFRLVGCTVSLVGYADGSASQIDPVVGMAVADANARVAGKIVDLDPQQQLVSEVWGLIVRLTDGSADYFVGTFDVASFSDIWWARAQGSGAAGDNGAGSFWQSVIGPVTWGDTSGSRLLQELRAAAPDGLLSVKFNVDGYNLNSSSAAFTLGRIVGTIGPASPSEPRHFAIGRHLLPQLSGTSPAGPMNFMPAVVDAATRRVLADFGNALPTVRPGGDLANIGDLELGYLDGSNAFHSLGALDYRQPGWYPTTAAIQAFPPDRPLTDAELTALAQNRLAVAQGGTPIVQENIDGLHLRADTFTFRVEPGETAEVQLWASQYGAPLPNASLVAFRDPSGLQSGIGDPNDGQGPPPSLAVPPGAIRFPGRHRTDAQGRATLPITASDPDNPRGYIDGQVYGVRYWLEALVERLRANRSFGWNPSDFVSLLVFDTYTGPGQPTWYDLQPIWQQYANLYPLMGRLVNLASYDDVAAHANILAFAFALSRENPNYMPVTRDLSRGRRAAILRWLTQPGPDGKPRLGEPPVPPAPPRRMRAAEVTRPRAAPPRPAPLAAGPDPRAGAKVYAMSRRTPLEIPDTFDDE